MPTDASHIRKTVMLSTLSFLISIIIYLLGVFHMFELKAYDLFSRYLGPSNASDGIVIVQIDQQSIDILSKDGIVWPWPREFYAAIVRHLSEADAVFIDMLFTESSSYGQSDDVKFSESLKETSNVYLPVFLSSRIKDLTKTETDFIKSISVSDIFTNGSTRLMYNSVLTPIEELRKFVRGAGNVTISPDRDGVYRRVPLFFKLGQYSVPNFVLSYLIKKGRISTKDGVPYIDGIKIPLTDERLWLRFYRDTHPFPIISAIEILKQQFETGPPQQPSFTKEYFRGKKVFIGLTAAGLYDLKPTSVSGLSTGVLINATILDNLINKIFLKTVDAPCLIVFLLVICFLSTYAVLKQTSVFWNLSIFLAFLSLTILIPAGLFKESFYLNITTPPVALLCSFIISVAYSYATEGKQKRFIRTTFAQYMDETIVDYILKNPQVIKLGGTRKRVTVFFTDVAGFTSLSEHLPPEDVAKILNTFFSAFTEVLIRNKGVIDKYIGDSVMAFWGAPVQTENDELNACYSALECVRVLKSINRSFVAEGLPAIDVRIGIHSGDAVVGNLGSDRLFDYTVVGDTVNLASRLESVNKVFKTRIIISGDTLERIADKLFARDLGLIEVKGRTTPVRIFELIAKKENIEDNIKKDVELYTRGVALFNEMRWQEALKIFEALLAESSDGPAEFYKKWCESMIKTPQAGAEWNVIKLTEK